VLAFWRRLGEKPAMLHLNDLTYRLGPRLLIDQATVALPPNAKVGLVGRNGTGKTTLFRIILGELATESGGVGLPKNVRIGAVSQEAPGGPESLIEVVLAADTERNALLAEAETTEDPMRRADIEMRLVDIGAYSAEARAASILHGLGFDAAQQRRPCSSFSGGWRMRVALAAVLFTEPDLLLLDEPTNYLDLEGTLWLYDYLGRYPHTVLVISHDRELLDTCVDHILHLDQSKLTLYRGGYSSFDRQRTEKMVLLGKMKDKQEAERKHLQAFVDRFKAKASKAKQAQSRVKRLEKLAPISAIVDSQVLPFHFPEPQREMSPPLYTFDGASVGYGENAILSRLNLSIQPDDRIALLGPNGNGKSTFCKLLAAKLKPMTGEVRHSQRVEVAYFAQHQVDELRLGETPVQHIAPMMPDATEARIRARAAQMGFPASKADTKVAQLSGGEKARLMLGIATFKGPHLLILDEPTNHLDIDSRAALMEAINDYPGAVMLVSHDRFLIEACADRLWLVEGGTVKPFDGDLDEYRAKVLGGPSKPSRRDGAFGQGAPAAGLDKGRPARGKLEKRLKEIEQEIAKLDGLRQRIDQALGNAEIFVKEPEKAGRLSGDRAALDDKIARLEDDWLVVSTELGEG
jgi:ATP-binding cassette subfamily F protein 3